MTLLLACLPEGETMDYSNYGNVQPRQIWPCDAKSLARRKRMEAGEHKSIWQSIKQTLRRLNDKIGINRRVS